QRVCCSRAAGEGRRRPPQTERGTRAAPPEGAWSCWLMAFRNLLGGLCGRQAVQFGAEELDRSLQLRVVRLILEIFPLPSVGLFYLDIRKDTAGPLDAIAFLVPLEIEVVVLRRIVERGHQAERGAVVQRVDGLHLALAERALPDQRADAVVLDR